MEMKDKDYTKFTEVELYFVIDGMGGVLWRMDHESLHGRINITPEIQKDLDSMREEIKKAVDHTTRFGVTEPARDENGIGNDSYWTWYRFWDSWKKAMTDVQWREFDSVFSRDGREDSDIEQFLPKDRPFQKAI